MMLKCLESTQNTTSTSVKNRFDIIQKIKIHHSSSHPTAACLCSGTVAVVLPIASVSPLSGTVAVVLPIADVSRLSGT